jgi:hypothetical protein
MYHELGFYCTMCYVTFSIHALDPKNASLIASPLENQTIRTFSSKETRAGTYESQVPYECTDSSIRTTPTPRHPEDDLSTHSNIHTYLTYQTKPKEQRFHSHPTRQPASKPHTYPKPPAPAPAIMKPTLLALILAAISTSVSSAAPIPQDPINDLVSSAANRLDWGAQQVKEMRFLQEIRLLTLFKTKTGRGYQPSRGLAHQRRVGCCRRRCRRDRGSCGHSVVVCRRPVLRRKAS